MRMTRKARMTRSTETGMVTGPSAMSESAITPTSTRLYGLRVRGAYVHASVCVRVRAGECVRARACVCV